MTKNQKIDQCEVCENSDGSLNTFAGDRRQWSMNFVLQGEESLYCLKIIETLKDCYFAIAISAIYCVKFELCLALFLVISRSRVGDDLSRMGQFLISPKGLQFAVKQNVLSRSAVRVQASNGPINDGLYLPTSTLAQVALNPFGGHLLKQGINPLADTTADGSSTGIGII